MTRRPSPALTTPSHRNDDHFVFVREEPCGCTRVRCNRGHSPAEILESLGLSFDDILCDAHRHRRGDAEEAT